MKQFIVGAVLGSPLTGSLGVAGSFYDRNGQPSVPAGSIQQFDYFRQFLDVQAMRREADRRRLDSQTRPCRD